MQSLQDFWSIVFLKSAVCWEEPSSSSDRSRFFAACLVYWLDYFISGFVQGRAAVLSLFPREISPTGVLILVIAMVVIRPVTEELIFRGALVNAYFKGWKLYAEIWLPALIYSGLHFLHNPFRWELLSSISCRVWFLGSCIIGVRRSLLLFWLISCSISTTPCLYFYLYLSSNRFPEWDWFFWKYGIIE